MPKRKRVQWIFPVVAMCLLAWWWFAERRSRAPAPVQAEAVSAPTDAPRTNRPEPARPQAIIPGGFVTPRLEDATPLEVEQLREAEVARSVQSPAPPKTFVGADGKSHAFLYNGSAQPSEVQEARDVRRKLLMQQVLADPVGFARTHGLAEKEVRWILEGSEDFPERLLD